MDVSPVGHSYSACPTRCCCLPRVTPNTHMGQRGVGERVRQGSMRHGDLRLTSAVCTDADQLPTKGATMALPSFTDGYAQLYTPKTGAGSPEESRTVGDDWVI
jgi:hypothetical protein